jgi:hypothetical protein
MISTSGISGTGLKKCMPMKRDESASSAASEVIEIDDVLVAMIASGRATDSICFRMRPFSSTFSVAASITMSTAASFA